MRRAGLSRQKLGYIRDLAEHALSGKVDFAKLPAMSDEEVIASLTDIKGVGVWTAHMFLLFSLRRPNVLPIGDLGVRWRSRKPTESARCRRRSRWSRSLRAGIPIAVMLRGTCGGAWNCRYWKAQTIKDAKERRKVLKSRTKSRRVPIAWRKIADQYHLLASLSR